MAAIDYTTNYNGIFFWMVGASLARTLTKSIRWINYFQDKKMRVVVPFYISMAGSERYALDAFIDDVADQRVELNTDVVPRGVITMQSLTTSSEEFANPNQYISKKTKINGEMRNVISKTKAIPIKITYNIEIKIDSEIDAYKCTEKILNMFFNYMFFNVDYFGIKIDAAFTLPDDKEITLPREINLTSDSAKKIAFTLVVNTYYPSFFIDTDDYEVCDNDGDVDWTALGLTPPSERDVADDENNVKRVYWESFINDQGLYDITPPQRSKYDSFDSAKKESFDPRGYINYPSGTTNA